jgi:iron-sulfur cluster assembly accessory protein
MLARSMVSSAASRSAWAPRMLSLRSLNTATLSSRSNNTTANDAPFSTAHSATSAVDETVAPKKWSRHVISNKPLIPEPESVKEPVQTQSTAPKRRKRRTLKPLKAPITLTENAKKHLRALSLGPHPKLIRISVRNRGCSGLTYHLEYVDAPEKFDEVVVQDDINVVIDSKALFSIIGSEMDWVDNKLSSKFVFKNPNSKGTCGCGESFMV